MTKVTLLWRFWCHHFLKRKIWAKYYINWTYLLQIIVAKPTRIFLRLWPGECVWWLIILILEVWSRSDLHMRLTVIFSLLWGDRDHCDCESKLWKRFWFTRFASNTSCCGLSWSGALARLLRDNRTFILWVTFNL